MALKAALLLALAAILQLAAASETTYVSRCAAGFGRSPAPAMPPGLPARR